MGAFVY